MAFTCKSHIITHTTHRKNSYIVVFGKLHVPNNSNNCKIRLGYLGISACLASLDKAFSVKLGEILHEYPDQPIRASLGVLGKGRVVLWGRI